MVIKVPWDELLLSHAVMAKVRCDRTIAQPSATSAQPQPEHTSSTDLSFGTTAQRTAPASMIQAIKRRKNKPKNAATEDNPMARSLRMFAEKGKGRSNKSSPAKKASKAKKKTAKTPAPRKKGKMQLAISPQTGVHNPQQYLLLSFCPPRRRRTEVTARLDRVICQSGATDKVRVQLSFFYCVQQIHLLLANSFRIQKGDKVEYNWGPEYGVLTGSYVRMSKSKDPG